MGILRLTKGELKKIFLKPGIFVVTALLVLVLTVSAFIFNLMPRNEMLVRINGNTIVQMYDNSFGASSDTNILSKKYLEARYITSSTEIIDFYNNEILLTENSKQAELLSLISNIKSKLNSYKISIMSASTATEEKKTENKENVKKAIEDFNSTFNSYVNGVNGFNYLLISTVDKTSYDVYIANLLAQPFSDSIESHTAVVNKIEELDFENILKDYVNNLKIYLPTKEVLDVATENLNKSVENLTEIEQEIETMKTDFANSNSLDKKQEFRNLVTRYQQASVNAYNLTLLTMNDSALSKYSDDVIQSLYQFQNEENNTKYEIKEEKVICEFYLNNNKYAYEFANPLSLTETSNTDPSIYDFMYFALELCTFIIIIYIVFLGATMIAGEYANGTMKLLAIRPYSRGKVLFSKLLSTIIVGLIFIVLSFIITAVAGGILFGIESLNMLLIFNATEVASVSPIVVLLLLFICKVLEMIFYAIFALSISTLFKSNSGSIVVSLLIYFASFVLTMFTPSLGILKFLPFVNTNLFGYFGSHVSGMNSNIISNMFSKVIANDMNFYISFLIILLFSVIIYIITHVVFRNRDINK